MAKNLDLFVDRLHVGAEIKMLSTSARIQNNKVVSFKPGLGQNTVRAQELCESRGGRLGLPSLINLWFLWT